MENLFNLLNFVQGQTGNIDEQAEMLAAFGAPPEEELAPKQKLPVQNDMPAFSLKQAGVGTDLAGLDYGVPAPVFGQKGSGELSIGELLTGDIDG